MNEPKKVDSNRPGSCLVGFASIALGMVGVGGVVAAIGAIGGIGKPDFVGAGVCLIASSLSFGLLLNALLRD